MAKKKKENNSEIKSNPIIKQLLTAGLDIFKHFVKDLENKKKIKKIDKMDEQFTAIENLLLKQEKMLQENRRLIENLKNNKKVAGKPFNIYLPPHLILILHYRMWFIH